MTDALLDTAPPGRGRPSRREVAESLRARLGRPGSRGVVVWAVLTSVVGGLFAAAIATRAGWETARPLPRAAEARAMLGEILPGQEFADLQEAPALFVIYGQPLSWDAANSMLFGDGGEYGLGVVGGELDRAKALPRQETVDLVSRNLRAYGWKVYPIVHADIYECVGPPCDPTTIPQSTTIMAGRGDTTFTMEVNPAYNVSFGRATPIAVYPIGLAGGILGAVVAFLLFGWASRRTEGRHPFGAVVKLLLGVTLVFWWMPTMFAFVSLTVHHLGEVHVTWHPTWEWLGQPTFSLLFLIGCGSALLALSLAAVPRRAGTPVTSPSAGI